jgi:hypothetical protein
VLSSSALRGNEQPEFPSLATGERVLLQITAHMDKFGDMTISELHDGRTHQRIYPVPLVTESGDSIIGMGTAEEVGSARVKCPFLSSSFGGGAVECTFTIKGGEVFPSFSAAEPGRKPEAIFVYVGLDEKVHVGAPGQNVSVYLGRVPCLDRALADPYTHVQAAARVKVSKGGRGLDPAAPPRYFEVSWVASEAATTKGAGWRDTGKVLSRGNDNSLGKFYLVRP